MNPILLNIPDQFETPRLIVRVPRAGDGAKVSEAVNASLDELRPWMPWAQEPQSVEFAEEFARRNYARFILREDIPLYIFRREDGQYLGGTGLHRMNWAVPSFEIGYWIRTAFSGQGYITEAVNGVTNFAFTVLNAQRLEIRCDARNIKSTQVAQRAGYTLEATFKKHEVAVDGSLRDTLVFSKFPDTPNLG